MKKVPFPYQQQLLDEAKTRTRLALFWEMRLGKSLTAWWWLQNKNPRPERILIICPKSVIVSWKEQLTDEGVFPILIFDSKNTEIQKYTENLGIIAITNYETVTSKKSVIKDQAWDAIIVDESTKIKNPSTKISETIANPSSFPHHSPQWASKCKYQYRVILTGTPAPESYLNYFQQFKFLFGRIGDYNNYYHFRKENFYFDANSRSKYVPKFHFISQFARFLDKYSYKLRRKDVGIDLPNIMEKRYVQMSDEHRKVYDEFEENWFSDFLNEMLKRDLTEGQSFKQLETQFATVAQSYLHQMACGFPKNVPTFRAEHKLNELLDIIENDLDPSDKVVIWCQYRADIRAVCEALNARYAAAESITGDTSTEALASILERFRRPYDERRAVNYLVCQIRKASMGMDLSAADTQIFFSRSWSALDNQQAIDRLIHPEKKNKPNFSGLLTIDIITENTIDEDMYNALIEKKANADYFKWFLKRTNFSLKGVKIET